MVDGTRSKSNSENVSICIRYVKKGNTMESLLSISFTPNNKLDALSITDLTLRTLSESGLDPLRILSQCYDDASVMKVHEGFIATISRKKYPACSLLEPSSSFSNCACTKRGAGVVALL